VVQVRAAACVAATGCNVYVAGVGTEAAIQILTGAAGLRGVSGATWLHLDLKEP